MKDYEIKDGKIYRYEPIDICEGFAMLADRLKPEVVLKSHDSGSYVTRRLAYIRPDSTTPWVAVDGFHYKHCARIETIDPRAVPEGIAELPEPFLAFVGKGPLRGCEDPEMINKAIWKLPAFTWIQGAIGNQFDVLYAIDVRTEFAKQHFPEYVEAVGYRPELEGSPEKWHWMMDWCKRKGLPPANEQTWLMAGEAFVNKDRYGYLTTGEPVPPPPEGTEIVPEGDDLPEAYVYYSESLSSWRDGCHTKRAVAENKVRAYARRVSPISKPEEPRINKINKGAYLRLVEGDLEWLEKQPDCLEKGHITAIVEQSVDLLYPKPETGIERAHRLLESGLQQMESETKPDAFESWRKSDHLEQESIEPWLRRAWDAAIASVRNDDGECDELLDLAWGIIANASGGDWEKESADWQEAAAQWRDRYHETASYEREPIKNSRGNEPKNDDSELLDWLMELIDQHGVKGLMNTVNWGMDDQPFNRECIRAAMEEAKKGGAE